MDSPSVQPKTKADIGELRELLGISQIDLFYLLGMLPKYFKMDDGTKEVLNLRLNNIVRLLLEEPHLSSSILPVFHNLEETYIAIEEVWDAQQYGKFSNRKFAHIIGVTSQTMIKWIKGEAQPSASTMRLFHLLTELIHKKGVKGLNLYLQIVDDSAKSLGIKGGLEKLISNGPPTKKTKNSDNVN